MNGERTKMEAICDKCGKPIEGGMIMSQFSFYHLECFKRRPLHGRLADVMNGDLRLGGRGAYGE